MVVRNFVLILMVFLGGQQSTAQGEWKGKFEQLGQLLPTPNIYRSADGSPGPEYWQQRADYDLDIEVREEERKIIGRGKITYYNNSPQTLTHLWLQLDQNRRAPDSDERATQTFSIPKNLPAWYWGYLTKDYAIAGGMHIEDVRAGDGKALPYAIEKTMMRVDLPIALKPGKKYEMELSWWYNINNRMEDRGRSGFEYFPQDGNDAFTIAQFYPRLAVYDDYEGWQNKQFLGSGEFALTFGNFEVDITVPDDHLLMATGDLLNPREVLTKECYRRYQSAQESYDRPVVISGEQEAREREKGRSQKKQTWRFRAKDVRDFAFASSRKYIWDAQAVKIGGRTVLAQSLYPKEGNPLWEKESTKAVINTLKTYSKYSLNYPYPHATSVHAAAIGMEYPMICFNFGRPAEDGSYTDAVKHGMIGVVIHEVGHNFFPMIVNSDERQWTWMDEGINSFLEYRTEQECYDNFPSSRGPASTIVPYMKGDKKGLRPIMTNSEQVLQLGNNAYGKPATALNILRETILGPESFDHAFKSFASRWAFKHPKPADFFRTMEDVSGVDLDWFWRGWFYTVDHVDISIDSISWVRTTAHARAEEADSRPAIGSPALLNIVPTPAGVYWEFNDRIDEESLKKELAEKELYTLHISNKGGLVMPIILEFTFDSGKTKRIQLPAEIWRKNENQVKKVFSFDEPVTNVVLDPEQETADVDTINNYLPRLPVDSPFGKEKDKT